MQPRSRAGNPWQGATGTCLSRSGAVRLRQRADKAGGTFDELPWPLRPGAPFEVKRGVEEHYGRVASRAEGRARWVRYLVEVEQERGELEPLASLPLVPMRLPRTAALVAVLASTATVNASGRAKTQSESTIHTRLGRARSSREPVERLVQCGTRPSLRSFASAMSPASAAALRTSRDPSLKALSTTTMSNTGGSSTRWSDQVRSEGELHRVVRNRHHGDRLIRSHNATRGPHRTPRRSLGRPSFSDGNDRKAGDVDVVAVLRDHWDAERHRRGCEHFTVHGQPIVSAMRTRSCGDEAVNGRRECSGPDGGPATTRASPLRSWRKVYSHAHPCLASNACHSAEEGD